MARRKVSKPPLLLPDPPATLREYDAQAKGETVKINVNVTPPADIAKIVRKAISFPIRGPFPRLVGEGETFTQAELDRQGLKVIYKRGHAVIQSGK